MEQEDINDRWAREKQEKLARYRELYNGIARHLPGWSVTEKQDEYEGYAFHLVSGVKYQRISLTIQKDKVHVSGYWPQRAKHGPYTSPNDVREESPSINCSLAKGHETIARDIARRFLPAYLRIWALLEEKIKADNAYQDRKAANWQRLIVAGVEDWTRPQDGSDKSGSVSLSGSGYCRVRMASADSVQIELSSLPVDVAIAVLNALRGIK